MTNIKFGAIAAVAILIFVGLLTTNTFSAETASEDIVTPRSTELAGFIKFDGIDGEATDKDHKGWCDLLSFEQSQSVPGKSTTGSSRRRGDVIMDDVKCTKELDKASPKIAEDMCKGKVHPKVEIHLQATFTDAGRVTYYRYDFTNVLITSYTIGNDPNKQYPTEEIKFNFEKIKVTYSETDENGKVLGTVEYSWDVEKDKD
ncbi:MAG: type VI secretion system tube protein Hcp [Thermoplasmata archaeon]|nr:MAG: type VI secretion system tube protein Hcp [Thermoplasmata archaeon]